MSDLGVLIARALRKQLGYRDDSVEMLDLNADKLGLTEDEPDPVWHVRKPVEDINDRELFRGTRVPK
jgi:hypothetical protein